MQRSVCGIEPIRTNHGSAAIPTVQLGHFNLRLPSRHLPARQLHVRQVDPRCRQSRHSHYITGRWGEMMREFSTPSEHDTTVAFARPCRKWSVQINAHCHPGMTMSQFRVPVRRLTCCAIDPSRYQLHAVDCASSQPRVDETRIAQRERCVA